MNRSRSRAASPARRDLIVAAAVTVLELTGLRTGPPSPEPSAAVAALGLVLSVAQGVPLAWRRLHPWPVLMVVTAAFVAHALVVAPVPPYGGWVALAALAVARDARATALATGGLVAAIALAYLPTALTAEDVALPAVVTVAVAVTGQLVRERRARSAALAERVAAEERLRIARDLHDVLGHSLSGIAVQSSTGRLALDAGRQEVAHDALTAIEEASRASMREVREVLGALRDAAAPGLEEVGDLVRSASHAGVRVTLRRHGDLLDLPGTVSRVAYRVVQECLTNVARHAGPCRAEVTVRRVPGRLEVEVTDDGQGAGVTGSPGHGLVGMWERVSAAGGEMSAGPRSGGGWRVRVELPVREGT